MAAPFKELLDPLQDANGVTHTSPARQPWVQATD